MKQTIEHTHPLPAGNPQRHEARHHQAKFNVRTGDPNMGMPLMPPPLAGELFISTPQEDGAFPGVGALLIPKEKAEAPSATFGAKSSSSSSLSSQP